MDTDLQPEYYRDTSPQTAVKDTEDTIAHIKALDPKYALISPIITPRFAPSCSDELLSSLGKLAKTEDLPIQTHISENRNEIALVSSLFPAHDHYAGVYDAHGLLTPRTVLAHGVHLSKDERALVKERGSSVSHCPVSNSSLSSGICRVRRLLDEGVKIGLGTDVSGGYAASVLAAAREAGIVSRILAGQVGWVEDEGEEIGRVEAKQTPNTATTSDTMANDKEQASAQASEQRERIKLSPEECLYLATVGGARCLNLETKIGTFEVGKEFDAQIVEVEQITLPSIDQSGEGGGGAQKDRADAGVGTGGIADEVSLAKEDQGLVQLWGNESWSDRIAKWVFCGDDRNTRRVYVKGRLVHER